MGSEKRQRLQTASDANCSEGKVCLGFYWAVRVIFVHGGHLSGLGQPSTRNLFTPPPPILKSLVEALDVEEDEFFLLNLSPPRQKFSILLKNGLLLWTLFAG